MFPRIVFYAPKFMPSANMFRHLHLLAFLTVTLLILSTADAKTLYVNNRLGSDGFDGSLEAAVSGHAGPLKTIGRALKLATISDLIVVVKTEEPYYETLTIMGRDNSGTRTYPFRIVSQGAIISGAQRMAETGWKKVGQDLWKVVPYRKGSYQLIRAGKALKELRRAKGERWYKVPKLAENQWCHLRGAIYYHAEQFADPGDDDFAIAQATTGATFLKVEHVVVRGLIFQHFRVDGVHLHNQAENIVLDNVGIYENGRAGVVVSGTSTLRLKESSVQGNRDHSVLLQGVGAMVVQESDWDKPPTLKPISRTPDAK
jgi:hypothetical protein